MKWTIRSLLAVLAVAMVLAVLVKAEHAETEAELEVGFANPAGHPEDLSLELEGDHDLSLENADASLIEADADVEAGTEALRRRRRFRRFRRVGRKIGRKLRKLGRKGRRAARKLLRKLRRRRRRRSRRRRGIFRRLRRKGGRLARALRRRARKASKRARKAARKANKRARKAARKAARIAKKNARRLRKASKKAARRLARQSSIRSLAKQLKRAGAKGRKSILKSRKRISALAKRLKLSAAQVKRAIKNPRRMIKKAKKSAKKLQRKLKKQIKKGKKKAKRAAKKAKKRARKLKKRAKKARKAKKRANRRRKSRKGRKFQPKGGKKKNKSLSKKLKKVVEGEPESAAITKAKNNWAWEDKVVKRLDTYVPPDPRNIKQRIATFESEADDTCTKAEVLCVQSNMDHPVNGKTCQKAQKACFHAKVALRVIREASDICVKAEVPCASKHWRAKGQCLVQKAKCKRLLNAANYQYGQIHKVGKKVRDMHFNDNEAYNNIDTVHRRSVEVRKAQKDHDEAEAKAMKCSETISVAKTCELNMDESPKCVKAQKDVTVCKAVVKEFRGLQKNLKKQIRRIDFAISRRNAAQAEAKFGAAF